MPSIYIIKPKYDYSIGDVYYGSTEQFYLCNRMANHRSYYKKYKNGTYHYVTVFDLFDKYGVDNCKIELVEQLENATRNDMLTKESEYIMNNLCINKANPKPLSKEDYKQKSHIYYETVIKANEEKHNKLKEQSKIFLKQKEEEGPIQCECGGTYTYKHKSRHCTTLEHKLGTDSEFKAQYEEEQKQKKEERKKEKQKKEERKERVKEYKAKFYQNNKNKNKCISKEN